ncbi:MAG: hypothetical protein AB1468_01455 [Candidatus Micrarchaeota archaeon]
MITGGKMEYVEAKRDKYEVAKGLSLNITIDDIVLSDGELEVKYTYIANYQDGVGELTIRGSVFAREESERTDAIMEGWTRTKNLPEDFVESVLNSINYACGVNGIQVVRVLDLAPPIVAPKIELARRA